MTDRQRLWRNIVEQAHRKEPPDWLSSRELRWILIRLGGPVFLDDAEALGWPLGEREAP